MADETPAEAIDLRRELRVLSDINILLERYNFAKQHGMSFNGARDLYTQLGYEIVITPTQYRATYDRGGIAGRVVDALPMATWRGEGELYEDEDVQTKTEFERAWYALNDRLKIWPLFQRTHILASLGRYAVILLGDGQDLSTELKRGRPDNLIYLQPFAEDDAKIESLVQTTTDPRFGRPATYLLKRTNITDPDFQKPVHWSRIIHVPACGFLDDDIYGPPALQRVWNYLDDLMKVTGGGAEAYFLRANPVTQFDTDKDMSFSTPEAATAHVESMKAKAELIKHQIQRWIETRGVKMVQMGSDVANFKESADSIKELIAGAKAIPQRILFGSEAGSLASDQDRDNWNDTVSDHRTSYAGPYIVRNTIDRFIKYGFLPTPKQYSVRWPDIKSLSMTERLDAAEKAAKLNDHGQLVITTNEIRETYLEREPIDPAELPAVEEQQVAQLEAALRKGGTLSLAVKP